MERLDEAVYRILHVKFSLGLMDRKEPFALKEYPLLAGDSLLRLQREAARRAWILLRNNKATLPLAPGSRVLLRGQALEDPYAWNGSWSRTWQGTDTLWDRLNAGPTLKEVMPQRFSLEESTSSAQPRTGPNSKPSAMVVVLAEKPSTEKPGDLESLSLSFEEIQQVQQWCRTHQGPKILVLVQNQPESYTVWTPSLMPSSWPINRGPPDLRPWWTSWPVNTARPANYLIPIQPRRTAC